MNQEIKVVFWSDLCGTFGKHSQNSAFQLWTQLPLTCSNGEAVQEAGLFVYLMYTSMELMMRG